MGKLATCGTTRPAARHRLDGTRAEASSTQPPAVERSGGGQSEGNDSNQFHWRSSLLKSGPNFRTVMAITVGLSAVRQVRPQPWSALVGKVVPQSFRHSDGRSKMMAMNYPVEVDSPAPRSLTSTPRVVRSGRRGSPRLRKHRLGDFHQLFGRREEQANTGCYRLGDVIVLHCGWYAQGLGRGDMVTVKSVRPSGVDVFFDSRQEGGRIAVLSPQQLSSWDVTVHRQPRHVVRPWAQARTDGIACGQPVCGFVAGCLVEDW